jgi:HSP20 family protein
MTMLFPDPFDALYQFQQALDALQASDWLEKSLSGGGAYPPINVFRKGDDIAIVAELPGVRKSDLRIEAKGRTIRISGTKTLGYGDKASFHRRERSAGGFDRTVALPVEIDADRIRAECRDGILALLVPRAERDKPKSIPVT